MINKKYIVYSFSFVNDQFQIDSAKGVETIQKDSLDISKDKITGCVTLPVDYDVNVFFNTISEKLKQIKVWQD